MADEDQKKLPSGTDYNPDHNPSSSSSFVEENEDGYTWIFQVRGEGVICLRAVRDDNGVLRFRGISILTKDEIGPSPSL